MSAHHGVISRQQCRELGMSDDQIWRRVKSGKWQELLPGVYFPTGYPTTWERDLTAALEWAGPGAAASHRCAASIWELRGFQPRSNDPVELAIETGFRPKPLPTAGDMSRRLIVHRATRLPSSDITRSKGFRVTTPARTLLDLAAANNIPTLGAAMDDALGRGLVSMRELWGMVRRESVQGRNGIKRFRCCTGSRTASSARVESVLESRVLDAIVAARLPEPVPQYEIWNEGVFIARVDFAYPERKIAIEADGYAFHGGATDWQRDLHRQNALVCLGWTVIRVTWDQIVRRQHEFVAALRQLLN